MAVKEDLPEKIARRFVPVSKTAERPSSTIYRATDEQRMGTHVALKLFIDSAQGNHTWIEAFNSQVEVLAGASHSALVKIIAGGYDERDRFYLAMEYINGPSLYEVLSDRGALEMEEAEKLTCRVGHALSRIHREGTIHGHVDSRAILFQNGIPKLAGFCPPILDQIQGSATSNGRMLIEPGYIAPEQINDVTKVDERVDVYALAALLFEVLTGRRPFTGKNALQTALKRLTESPPSASKLRQDIPVELDLVLTKALARNPKDRYQTMDEFVEAVTANSSSAGGKTVRVNSRDETPPPTGTLSVATSIETVRAILADHNKSVSKNPKTRDLAHTPDGPPSIPEKGTGQSQAITGTVLSTPQEDLLVASFMVLDGSERGTSFPLVDNRVLIGSDEGCEITLPREDLPARYAIVVRREGGYFVGPLSATPLTINGNKVDGTGEIKLARGDILHGGSVRLRFVAPGEVFSLNAETVDRVIDRPKSKISTYLARSTAFAFVFAVLVLYSYQQASSSREESLQIRKMNQAQERDELIAKLIQEGDELFRKAQFVVPAEANAYRKFQEVLQLEPDNVYAKQRIDLIKERTADLAQEERRRKGLRQRIEKLLADGDRYFTNGNYILPPGRNAREVYTQVLQLDPRNSDASARLNEIQDLLSSLSSKVEELLNRAEELKNRGNYIRPAKSNAYFLIKKVLEIDPSNSRAKDLLYDIAARSIFEGDQAKRRGQAAKMQRSYLLAKSIGLDPGFISSRLQGIELMRRAKSRVIIYARPKNTEQDTSAEGERKYLDSDEVERRIAILAEEAPLENARARFIDITNRNK